MSSYQTIGSELESDIYYVYKMACRNHYSFDSLGYIYFNEDIDKFSGIPRPAKWIKNEKLKGSFKKCSRLISAAWRYIFAYFYFLLKFISYIIKAKKRVPPEVRNLLFSPASRSVAVFNAALVDPEDKHCLSVPWADVSKELEPSGFIEIKLLNVVSKVDVCKALLLACKAHLKLSRDKNIAIQTYTGVDWFLVYIAISNIKPTNIFTAEHHDRWAVLLDFIAKNHGTDSGAFFTIVQHGLEHESTYFKMRGTRYGKKSGLPYKLANVDRLYAYDQDQHQIIIKNIITPQANLIVNYFRKKLLLSNISQTTTKRILFVGHPFCYDLQVYLYENICAHLDLEIYYKPHPTTGVFSEMRNVGWLVIEDRGIFPEVDYLISYPSTLAIEYKDLNTPLFTHALTEEESNFPLIAEEVILFLSSKMAPK